MPSPNGGAPEANGTSHTLPSTGFLALAIGSIGVVYGDIGTSPLYAFREAAHAAAGDGVAGEPEILGVLSLIVWTLTIVVTFKYVLVLMRADNHGEGGSLALMALALRAVRHPAGMILLGVAAAALFYGDAILTPALSVLSAVEGLEVAAPGLEQFVLPLTIVILVVLFAVQSRGTARVATFFGPICCVWFAVLAILGVANIAGNPEVLRALSPAYAITFVADHGFISFLTLGAVFLAVTGAEALYADLGHFGRKPIQAAWVFFVFPALVLNYFGQGALVLEQPETLENPFFLMAPEWAQLPLVVLATAATVIASQAVITGAFSLTRQAVQLGLLPRFEIRHTSEKQAGQIYMPRVNLLLLVGVVLTVGLFRSSGALAGAYGIAVSGTMVVTGILAFIVVRRVWKWPLVWAALLMAPFLAIDVTFLLSNSLKIPDGGWFPLLLGAALVVVMLTWRRGSAILFAKTRRLEVPLEGLIANLTRKSSLPRVAGTALFLTSDPQSAPTALLHTLKHFKVLHETNVIVTVRTAETPRVPPDEQVTMDWLTPGFARLSLSFGFAETPNIPKALAAAKKLGWQFDIMSTSFILSRRSLRRSDKSGMPAWQDRIFLALARSAADATNYFRIPTERAIEIGTQVAV